MQPLRYMALVASTKTFRSPNLTTLSIMPAWFSKLMEYWKPEQPPPTTPMRRPAGIGSWVAMISLTLEMAESVSSTAFLRGASGPLTTSATGTAVVDMETSLFPEKWMEPPWGAQLSV